MSDSLILKPVSANVLAERTEWITARDALIVSAAKIQAVDSQASLDMAGRMLKDMKGHIKDLDKARKAVTAPIDKVKKAIMAQQKELCVDLGEEVLRVQKLGNDYATQQAAAAEKARRDDATEFNRRGDAEAFGLSASAPEPVAVPIPTMPVILPPKASDSRLVTRWKCTIIDSRAVPRDFCTPNESAIRQWMNSQVAMGRAPQMLGVKFTSTVNVESSGR